MSFCQSTLRSPSMQLPLIGATSTGPGCKSVRVKVSVSVFVHVCTRKRQRCRAHPVARRHHHEHRERRHQPGLCSSILLVQSLVLIQINGLSGYAVLSPSFLVQPIVRQSHTHSGPSSDQLSCVCVCTDCDGAIASSATGTRLLPYHRDS